MRKLGILATHPIQYFSPLYRRLAAEKGLKTTVYYCHKPDDKEQGVGFGVPFQWDVDLLTGYESVWLKNVSRRPGLTGFGGCDTPDIADIISKEKFNAFLVTGWNKRSFWQAIEACGRTGTPLMVRADSQPLPHENFFKSAVKSLAYPFLVKRFRVCLAVGARSEAYFRRYGAKNVVRSPHFVDNEWFSQKAGIRARHEKPVFLFVGKFEEKKRPLDFLSALEVSGGEAIMVGDGPLKVKCEKFAREKKLNVRFAGFVNQSGMPAVYASADVLVLPSNARETWGLVVNEAMACGLPAIVSNEVGCAPDLVMQGRTGYTFPCGDVEKLAASMKRFLDDTSSANSMGGEARRLVSGFSVENAARGILKGMETV